MPLLAVRALTLRRDSGEGSSILNDVDFELEEGEIVVVKGESGVGKTTFLKCLAHLNLFQGGEIRLNGKTPQEYGIPVYRTLVQYIPQRPSMLPGTPLDFLHHILTFRARSKLPMKEVELEVQALAAEWGVEKVLWMREWGTLSGGEAQRLALAVAVGIGGAEVILLDEPTSALDAVTMQKVEKSLLGMLPRRSNSQHTSDPPYAAAGPRPKAFVWITHEAAQAERVGTRTFELKRA